MRTFDDIIELVKDLNHDEQEELQFVLQRILVEERRSEIAENFQASRVEEPKLKYSSSIKDLKKGL